MQMMSVQPRAGTSSNNNDGGSKRTQTSHMAPGGQSINAAGSQLPTDCRDHHDKEYRFHCGPER